MNYDVAEAGQLAPVHFGGRFFQGDRQTFARLSQDLELPKDGILSLGVLEEGLFAFGNVVLNVSDTVANVRKVNAVFFQTGTASAST